MLSTFRFASASENLIKVDQPRPYQKIESSLIVSGEARGSWFFEANFSVKLINSDEEVIATAVAQAKEDWMTKEFVPFEAELNFQKPETNEGILILKKANPSGLPEHEDEKRIPVRF